MRLPRVLNYGHRPFHLPSHCGEKAPFPFTTTTPRSFRPSPASERERNGNLAGWPPGEKYPSEGLKEASNRQEYRHKPAGHKHSLEPGRHLPARARAPAPGDTVRPDRAPTPPPKFRQGRLRSFPAASEAEGWARGGWFLCSDGL